MDLLLKKTISESEQIDLPKPEYIKQGMKRHIKRGENIMSYTGYGELMTLFYTYLMNKYKSRCPINLIDGRVAYGLRLTVSEALANSDEQYDKDVEYYKKISEKIVMCMARGVSPIIIPLSLEFPDSNSVHANMLIIRGDNTMEHFEPHGKQANIENDEGELVYFYLKEFTEVLNKQINEMNNAKGTNLKPVKLIPSSEVCPNIRGLQELEEASKLLKDKSIEDAGYCAAWSMFFTELVLKNPDVSSKDLYKMVYDIVKGEKGKDYLRKMIRGYVNYISSKIDKYFTQLFGEDINIESVLNKIKNDPRERQLFGNLIVYLIILEYQTANNLFDYQLMLNSLHKLRNDIKNNPKLSELDKKYKYREVDSKLNMLVEYRRFKNKFREAGSDTSATDFDTESMSSLKFSTDKKSSTPKKEGLMNLFVRKPTGSDEGSLPPKKMPDNLFKNPTGSDKGSLPPKDGGIINFLIKKPSTPKKSSAKKSSPKKSSAKKSSPKKSSAKKSSAKKLSLTKKNIFPIWGSLNSLRATKGSERKSSNISSRKITTSSKRSSSNRATRGSTRKLSISDQMLVNKAPRESTSYNSSSILSNRATRGSTPSV